MSLEREARRREMSMSAVLDLAAREWLEKGDAAGDDEEEHGAFASGDLHRSEIVSETVRQRVRRRHGR